MTRSPHRLLFSFDCARRLKNNTRLWCYHPLPPINTIPHLLHATNFDSDTVFFIGLSWYERLPLPKIITCYQNRFRHQMRSLRARTWMSSTKDRVKIVDLELWHRVGDMVPKPWIQDIGISKSRFWKPFHYLNSRFGKFQDLELTILDLPKFWISRSLILWMLQGCEF